MSLMITDSCDRFSRRALRHLKQSLSVDLIDKGPEWLIENSMLCQKPQQESLAKY